MEERTHLDEEYLKSRRKHWEQIIKAIREETKKNDDSERKEADDTLLQGSNDA